MKLISAIGGDGFNDISEVNEMTDFEASEPQMNLAPLNVLGLPNEQWFQGTTSNSSSAVSKVTNRTEFTEDEYGRIAVESSVMAYFTSTYYSTSTWLDCNLTSIFTGTTIGGGYGGFTVAMVNGSLQLNTTYMDLYSSGGTGTYTFERNKTYAITVRLRGPDVNASATRPGLYEVWVNGVLVEGGIWSSTRSTTIRDMTGPVIQTITSGDAEGDFRYRNLMVWDGFTTDENTPPAVLRVTDYVSTDVVGSEHTAQGGTSDDVITDDSDSTYIYMDGAGKTVEIGAFADVASDIRPELLRAFVSRTKMSRGVETTTEVSIRHKIENTQESPSFVKAVTVEHPTTQCIQATSTYDTTSTIDANDLSVQFVTIDNS